MRVSAVLMIGEDVDLEEKCSGWPNQAKNMLDIRTYFFCVYTCACFHLPPIFVFEVDVHPVLRFFYVNQTNLLLAMVWVM